MSEADYAVEGVKKEAGWPVVWLIGGLVLALALGYAVWEWRRDLAKLWSNLTTFFRRNSSR